MSDRPVLSTVLLSWNRKDLLETTLRSIIATASVPHELIVVDNASTDGARDFLQTFTRENPRVRVDCLDENQGALGLNSAADGTQGAFIHFSENDLEYLPGWDADLLGKFEAFPRLGQLSVFGTVHQMEQGEIWCPKEAEQAEAQGKSVFLTAGNVGTSSVIRREVWRAGVRWQNFEEGSFRFPWDGRFSEDVHAAGFDVAWNDKYVVVNWGHNVEEMNRRIDYYLENYRSKTWFGIEGFKQRLLDHGYRLVTRKGCDRIERVYPSIWERAKGRLRREIKRLRRG